MSAVAPRLRPAKVTVTLAGGRHNTQMRESHRGDFQQLFAEAEIRAKFHELAGVVLTAEGVTRIEDAIDRCEHWTGIAELTALFHRYARR
jgi:hypothetical protein